VNREREESRDNLQESIGFNKNIMKSSPLIIEDRGLVLVLVLA
jgi:hypothetical protein